MLAAVVSYVDARAHEGSWLVRIEDIDPPREMRGAAGDILRVLEATALTWDEPVIHQSANRERHESAITELRERGLAYFCRCSRRDVRAAAAAAGLGPTVYQGTCRERQLDAPGAVRVITDETPITANDRLQHPLTQRLESAVGDFIIRRRDGLIAYQLAVVIDDAEQDISDVVRGLDLWDNTPRQMWLQRLLGLPEPRYLHFPLLVNAAGDKLSKQTGAPAVDMRNPSRLLTQCLSLLHQEPPRQLENCQPPEILQWAVRNWRPEALRGHASLVDGSVAAQQNPLR